MGSRKWHLARAEHHLKTADHLAQTPQFMDWAFVALFYAAHQQVHSVLSGEPSLVKDERHPRKHNSPYKASEGGRGTNDLVGAFMRSIQRDYMSLFEAGRRTRYETPLLGDDAYRKFRDQHDRIAKFCELTNRTREDISTQSS